jgi:Zn-dependent M28 family amino/carboxypeptidase
MKYAIAFFFFYCLTCFTIYGQSALPEINIIKTYFDQNIEFLHIEYVIIDADDSEFTVDAILSNDDGQRFDFTISSATGDIGAGVVNDGPKEVILGCAGIDPIRAVARLIVSDNDTLDIQAVVDQVDMSRVTQNLMAIQGIRHRNGDAEHLDSVRTLIFSKLSDAGPSPSLYPFMFGVYEAQNIIGLQHGIGMPNSEYYVGGHYDSVINSPGADDNGTAIAAMLEAAHVLGALPFNKTIRYVAWDLEESGLVGSMDYVNNVLENEEDIEGYLNMEMIGYYKDEPNTQNFPIGFNLVFPDAYQEIQANEFRGDFLTNVGNTANSQSLMEAFEVVASEYVPELSVISIASPGTGAAVPDLLRSDHASFWSISVPAVMLTDGANFRNPYYHTANDVIDSLDMEFLTNNTKAVVAFLAEKSDYNHAGFVDMDGIPIISGTKEYSSEDHMKVFPNPAGDFIHLQWQNEAFNKIDYLRIYSIDGKLIKSLAVVNGFQNPKSIFVKDLEEGVYFIHISVDGQIQTGRFLVMH